MELPPLVENHLLFEKVPDQENLISTYLVLEAQLGVMF